MALAPKALRAAARMLAVDAATAEVVAAFRSRGSPSILLRGPAVARRLFDPDERRAYVDADLLVPPEEHGAAAETLTRLGFAPLAAAEDLARHRALHAHEWRRPADRVSVDLHLTISGARAPAEEVWHALAEGSEVEVVGGEEVAVPGPAGLALVVALHAAHNGPRGEKSLDDLARALDRLDAATWAEAAALARRLDAEAAFSAGLRLLPGGAEVAPAVRLPVEVALRAGGAPPLALGLDWLARRPGVRAKAALAAHVLAPPPGALRTWRVLARRGRRGLAAAYVSHPFWLARHSVPSLLALRRARRAAP
jgi:hypothetical protein